MDLPAEQLAKLWIVDVIRQDTKVESLEDLKSGVILCDLVNVIKPGSVTKISYSKMPFPQRENIDKFLEAVRNLGVPPEETFDTTDLYEARDPA